MKGTHFDFIDGTVFESQDNFREILTSDYIDGKAEGPSGKFWTSEIGDGDQKSDDDGTYFVDRKVVGGDDRKPVKFPEIVEGQPYNFHPYQTIGRILAQYPNGKTFAGTGTLISRRHIITAAHVINKKSEGLAIPSKIEFRPMEQNGAVPIGTTTCISASIPTSWTNGFDENYDFCILKLGYEFGNEVGWSGLVSSGDKYFSGVIGNVTGYPGDKGGKSMYTSSGPLKSVGVDRFEYEIDTEEGQSGAPVWHIDKVKNGPYIFAVHRGSKKSGDSFVNDGVRITKEKFLFIQSALKL